MNEVDKGKCVKAVVLDLAKAFDKVPHSLLLRKMEAYGFSTAILSWILQFLSERKQSVDTGRCIGLSESNFWCPTDRVPFWDPLCIYYI